MTARPVEAATARRLTGLVATEQATGRLPSLVAGVMRGGELVWSGAAGRLYPPVGPSGESDGSTGEASVPDVDTCYRVGSITKTMTALLVMQLRDEGALDLSDRLDVHVPGSAYGDRTLRALLSHSGGLHAELPGEWWERNPGMSFDSLQERLSGLVGAFPDGRRYHYSNVGFALLGEVVARLRGAPWAEVLRARLLKPLGMASTGPSPSASAANGFSVHPYAGTLSDEPAHDTGAMGPAGQVWSTVADLARYAAFLADPDPAVLEPGSIEEMTVVRSGVPDDVPAASYGLGLRLAVEDGATYVGHTGSMPGFLAGLFVDRRSGIGAVCLANGTTGLRCQGLTLDLIRAVEECEPGLPAPWLPEPEQPAEVRALLGPWHWGNTPFVVTVHGRDASGAVLALSAAGSSEPWCTFARRRASVGGSAGTGFVGVSGYLAGESLLQFPGDGTRPDRLECATFTFTRTPYDEGV